MELCDAPQLAASCCNWQASFGKLRPQSVVGFQTLNEARGTKHEDAAGRFLCKGLLLALSLISGEHQGSVSATVSNRLLSLVSIARLCASCGATTGSARGSTPGTAINTHVHLNVRSDTDVFANAAISTDTLHAATAAHDAEHHDKHNGCSDHHHHHNGQQQQQLDEHNVSHIAICLSAWWRATSAQLSLHRSSPAGTGAIFRCECATGGLHSATGLGYDGLCAAQSNGGSTSPPSAAATESGNELNQAHKQTNPNSLLEQLAFSCSNKSIQIQNNQSINQSIGSICTCTCTVQFQTVPLPPPFSSAAELLRCALSPGQLSDVDQLPATARGATATAATAIHGVPELFRSIYMWLWWRQFSGKGRERESFLCCLMLPFSLGLLCPAACNVG